MKILGVMRDCSSAYFQEPKVTGEKKCSKYIRQVHRREVVEEFCFCTEDKCNVELDAQEKAKRGFFHQLKAGSKDVGSSCCLSVVSLFLFFFLQFFTYYFVRLKAVSSVS